MKIKLNRTKNIGINPINHMCATGSKFSPAKHRYGSLVIYHEGVPLSKTFINAAVFRAALVNNKAFLKNELGIEVKDLFENVKEKIEVPEEPAQPSTVEDMSYLELKTHATKLGVDFKGNIKKEDLINLIQNHKEE